MRNERAWPHQCWKSCANGSNIVALRFGDHRTKEMLGVVGWKVWRVSNFVQQRATTSNNIQHGVQTDATCNIQQCWELLANNVASVCTGLKAQTRKRLPIRGKKQKKRIYQLHEPLLNCFHHSNRWIVSYVAAHLHTCILADTIWVPYQRITLGRQCQNGKNDTLLRIEILKSYTL